MAHSLAFSSVKKPLVLLYVQCFCTLVSLKQSLFDTFSHEKSDQDAVALHFVMMFLYQKAVTVSKIIQMYKKEEFAENTCVQAHLPPVEVLDDSEMQILFPLPLALHGVVEELSERPL